VNTRQQLARKFHDLHVRGEPLVLFNVWDPGSARAVAEAGAQAIATGSWSVAAANGFDDGEHLPLELALEIAARIAAAVELPVTIDFEGGYAEAAADVARNVSRLLETGVIGINFEDRIVTGSGLYDVAVQARRIAAIRHAAEEAGVALFINARTDLFLEAAPDEHPGLLQQALRRAEAYADAGASGYFVPGLRDEATIARIVEANSLPLNVMVLPALPPVRRLAALGVARISHGPGPYRLVREALQGAARAALARVSP
jgi:2-methylisocitrate lyase-like PEP mutase family enzyme